MKGSETMRILKDLDFPINAFVNGIIFVGLCIIATEWYFIKNPLVPALYINWRLVVTLVAASTSFLAYISYKLWHYPE